KTLGSKRWLADLHYRAKLSSSLLYEFSSSCGGRLMRSRRLGPALHLAIDRHSAVIGKQLDRIVEAAHRIFADTLQTEIAFDEIGERAGQQHRFTQLFGEGFETRSHVHRRTDHREVEPGAGADIA